MRQHDEEPVVEEDELMSFDKKLMVVRPFEEEEKEKIQNEEQLTTFYRERCRQFQRERQQLLDRLANVEVSKEEFHRLKWDLRMKDEEIGELEASLRKINADLFETKEKMIELESENENLHIQEQEDRKKIQLLLSFTQPVTEEVTFFRDCRPGKAAQYPVTASSQVFPYQSTMHISSEALQQHQHQQQQQQSEQNHKPQRQQRAPSKPSPTRRTNASTSGVSKFNKVFRTVYMPNDQTMALTKMIQNLKQQLDAHKSLSEAKLKKYMDVHAEEKAKLVQKQTQAEQKLEALERQFDKSQRLLHQTTKDYLVLRYQFQVAEQSAHEEVSSLKELNKKLQEQKQEAAEKALAETQAIRETIREEGNLCAQEFREQAISKERDMIILKEQYAAIQETYNQRIQDLQTRLTKLRSRYKALETRRLMEMEGFTRDLQALKRQLRKLEMMYYGTRLTPDERRALRMEERLFQNSSELNDEITDLQQQMDAASRAPAKGDGKSKSNKSTGKRKRRTPASSFVTSSRIQLKQLYASTRDELMEIQTELQELAQERKKLIERATTSKVPTSLVLVPAKESKTKR